MPTYMCRRAKNISLPSKDIKHEGTYRLNITIDNDVSKVQTQASFTLVVDKGLLNYYTYFPAGGLKMKKKKYK
jgi:hypothetical protein